jgi:hypothetical protein
MIIGGGGAKWNGRVVSNAGKSGSDRSSRRSSRVINEVAHSLDGYDNHQPAATMHLGVVVRGVVRDMAMD